jgi:hypothetical protein
MVIIQTTSLIYDRSAGKLDRGWRHKSTGHRATQSSGGLTSRDELVSARSSPQMHKKSAKRNLRQHALVQATYCVFAACSASVSHLSAISMKKDLCGELRAASAKRMHSAAFSRNWLVLISENNGPRAVRESLYLLCIDRDAKPGFGHTDQVSLAFRLTLGLYQELCRVYSAFSPSVHVSPSVTDRAG